MAKKRTKETRPSYNHAVAAWVFSGALFIYLGYVAFAAHDAKLQSEICHLFMALLAGFASFFFAGTLDIKHKSAKTVVAAGSGFAMFFIVETKATPISIRTLAGDWLPQFVVNDPDILEAQNALKSLELLTKTPDGVRDSQTTAAISTFQQKQMTVPNGYLTKATQDKLHSALVTRRLSLSPSPPIANELNVNAGPNSPAQHSLTKTSKSGIYNHKTSYGVQILELARPDEMRNNLQPAIGADASQQLYFLLKRSFALIINSFTGLSPLQISNYEQLSEQEIGLKRAKIFMSGPWSVDLGSNRMVQVTKVYQAPSRDYARSDEAIINAALAGGLVIAQEKNGNFLLIQNVTYKPSLDAGDRKCGLTVYNVYTGIVESWPNGQIYYPQVETINIWIIQKRGDAGPGP